VIFKTKKRIYVVLYLVICVILSFYAFASTFRHMTSSVSVDIDNLPYWFSIIGASDDKQYSLIRLGERFAYGRPSDKLIPGGEYYINEGDLPQITTDINKTFEYKTNYINIKILDVDKISKKQMIQLTHMNDDFIYKSIYEVNENEVIPLRYGDLTKRDSFVALRTGFLTFITGLIALKVVLVLHRRFSGKEQVKRQTTD